MRTMIIIALLAITGICTAATLPQPWCPCPVYHPPGDFSPKPCHCEEGFFNDELPLFSKELIKPRLKLVSFKDEAEQRKAFEKSPDVPAYIIKDKRFEYKNSRYFDFAKEKDYELRCDIYTNGRQTIWVYYREKIWKVDFGDFKIYDKRGRGSFTIKGDRKATFVPKWVLGLTDDKQIF